jgi:integrase
VHHHELHLARFAELVGPVEPRDVKRAHAIKYRDAVAANTRLSFRSKKKQIETLNAMFNLALSDGLVDFNPFHGVKIIQKDATKFSDVQVDRTLTGEQVKLIFDGLERFNMPFDFRWVVWLIAYHGMRSNEAAQLRCEDIVTLHGIPSIRIRDKADGQSLKNLPSVRDIPIHPKCLGIVEYAEKAAKIAAAKGAEPWVFQSFPTHWKSERRGAWFQTRAVRFLRHQVKIMDRYATMHSFRHTWITKANVLLMPDKISYAITGHKIRGHHGAYGKLPPVTECLPWLAQIDPLS